MLITNTLAFQFGFLSRAWIGLALSFLFGTLVFVVAGGILTKAVFYVLNSLVIFCVAQGTNVVGESKANAPTAAFSIVAPAFAETQPRVWVLADGAQTPERSRTNRLILPLPGDRGASAERCAAAGDRQPHQSPADDRRPAAAAHRSAQPARRPVSFSRPGSSDRRGKRSRLLPASASRRDWRMLAAAVETLAAMHHGRRTMRQSAGVKEALLRFYERNAANDQASFPEIVSKEDAVPSSAARPGVVCRAEGGEGGLWPGRLSHRSR